MKNVNKIVIIQAGAVSNEGFMKKFLFTNLTCASIAAAIPDNIGIEIIDMFVQDINYDTIDADLALVTTLTTDAAIAFEVSKRLRDKGIKVIGGGVHIVVCTDECQQHFDALAIGEAELLIDEIINDFNSDSLKMRYETKEQFDLTKSKLPRFDLLPLRKYSFFGLMASKGCAFNCDFCSSRIVTGPGFRHKTIEQIINEITYIHQLHEKDPLVPESFYFADSNLYTDRNFLIELLRALIPMKLKPWGLFASVNIAYDDEVLDLLKEANCESIQIGFESVNPNSLKSVNKKQNSPIQYKEIVERLTKRGIYTYGSFVFGFDNDDVNVFNDTLKALDEANFIFTGFFTLTPFPGTKVFERLSEEGRILHHDWLKYNMDNVVFKPKSMTAQELRTGIDYVRAQSSDPQRLIQNLEKFNDVSGKRFNLKISEKIALWSAYVLMFFKLKPRTRNFLSKTIKNGKLIDYNQIAQLASKVQNS